MTPHFSEVHEIKIGKDWDSLGVITVTFMDGDSLIGEADIDIKNTMLSIEDFRD